MATGTNLLDAIYKIRQGENRAVALKIIDRITGSMIGQADIANIHYTIVKRAKLMSVQTTLPPDEIVEGHHNVEIPISAIRDNPTTDPIDNVVYNFIFIIPCLDDDNHDITPFTECGATYDVMIRFVPVVGGGKNAVVKTIRIEVE
ncbi:MAG: hypothetical protein LBT05_10520 [Planctomycetaceae bacterium]|jgi:hypothetical protein|nr:hypothetical protein [Planctomycetaceae bacterium]